jgi:hypothetical protein
MLNDTLRNHRAISSLAYEMSARRDFRMYAMGAVGLVFAYAGATVDPGSNCSESGECVPWLVTAAFWIGSLAAAAAAANLIRNPRWGSRVDDQTQAVVTWNDFLNGAARTISLSDIATIRVETRMEDEIITLLGADGTAIAIPGADEVIPWPKADWAQAVAARYPHIAVDLVS